MGQFYVQDRGLQFVHSEIAPDELMFVARFHSVLSANSDPLGKFVVMTNDETGVAGRAKILGRIEAETARVAHCARLGRSIFDWKFSADRLRGVLHDEQVQCESDCEHYVY